MKRAVAIILSVITLVLLVASCNKNTDVPDGMEACTNNSFYTMFMPEGWKKIETGTDATLIQAVSKNGLTNVSANALYWQITAPDIDGEEAKDRNERLFNAFFDKYQSQLTGEYDQLGNGENKDISVSLKEENGLKKVEIELITENGTIKKSYQYKENGERYELYNENGEGQALNDGYIVFTVNTVEDKEVVILSKIYYYGVEYKLVGTGQSYVGYKKKAGIASELDVLSKKDLTVKDSPAREYVYTLKYADLYYKYYTTVIIHDDFYYVITFTFPERVSEKNDEIVTTREYDDGEYTEEMEKVVTNFIPKTPGK